MQDDFTDGIDGTPSVCLKDCTSVFVRPISISFNLIGSTSRYPNIQEKAFVTHGKEVVLR